MDSNAPQPASIRDAHFRSAPPARVEAPHKSFGWLIALLVIAALGIGIWAFWFRGKSAPAGTEQATGRGAGGREVPVVAIAAKQGDLPIYLNGLGTVTPFNLVTLRSRVEGQIMKIAFNEGQDVKEGDLLIEIDPRPYEVQL